MAKKEVSKRSATGFIVDGSLQLRNRKAFVESLRDMDDGDVMVSVAKAEVCRSNQQNSYYWSILERVADATGMTPLDAHAWFKSRFLSRPMVFANKDTGQVEEQQVPVSTRSLPPSDFFDYTEEVRVFAAEFLNVSCETPNRWLRNNRDWNGLNTNKPMG